MTTIELIQTITKNKELTYFSDPSKREFFMLSEKQFKWLWGVFACENMKADSAIGATVKDEHGNAWGLNWNNSRWNVPHYIKNYQKYGKTYFIHFAKAQ